MHKESFANVSQKMLSDGFPGYATVFCLTREAKYPPDYFLSPISKILCYTYFICTHILIEQIIQYNILILKGFVFEVRKGATIRNRCNQVPHLTQDTNEKVTNSPLDTTNESQEVSSFPAGDHKAQINKRIQRHNKHKTEKKVHKRSTALERSVEYFTRGLKPVSRRQPHPYIKCGSRHIYIWFA